MPDSLDDLLLELEERRQRGEAVSAASLCPGAPAAAAELERRIRLLESLGKVLTVAAGSEPLPPVAAPLPECIGRYQVQRALGRGATGVVYEAWDPTLCLTVAVKVLRPSFPAAGPTEAGWLARRFAQEVQFLAQLKHEHIVRVYEAGLYEGEPYFVMECVTGGSLAEQREALTAAGPTTVVRCLEAVARAVAYAHSRDVLHRDLKPGNILLDAEGRPVVSDFGLAKLLGGEEAAPARATPGVDTPPEGTSPSSAVTAGLTAPGCQPGTPPYMAPEQFDAAFGPIGPTTDIWALGVILYELVTGVKPFPGPRDKLREQVCGGHFERPRSLCPRLDPRLERVILRCLAVSPQARYASAAALAEDLAAWQKPSRRAWLAAAVGVLILAPVATVLLRPRDPEEEYRGRVLPMLDELRQGRRVELIPPYPGDENFFTLRSGARGTGVKRVQDGLNIHCPYRCCLLELLPEVPGPRYRLRVLMRRERALLTQEHQWGVYCRHNSLLTEQGRQHSFTALSFVGPEEREGTPGTVQLSAALRPCLFAAPPRPVDRQYREYFYAAFGKGNVRDAAYVPGPDNPWVEITVTVLGGEVRGSFQPAGAGAVMMAPVTADDQRDSRQVVRRLFPDLAGSPDERLDGCAVGIYVCEADCTVASFVVETIPDN
jgi:serine/threonine protein kinase